MPNIHLANARNDTEVFDARIVWRHRVENGLQIGRREVGVRWRIEVGEEEGREGRGKRRQRERKVAFEGFLICGRSFAGARRLGVCLPTQPKVLLNEGLQVTPCSSANRDGDSQHTSP